MCTVKDLYKGNSLALMYALGHIPNRHCKAWVISQDNEFMHLKLYFLSRKIPLTILLTLSACQHLKQHCHRALSEQVRFHTLQTDLTVDWFIRAYRASMNVSTSHVQWDCIPHWRSYSLTCIIAIWTAFNSHALSKVCSMSHRETSFNLMISFLKGVVPCSPGRPSLSSIS